jgi:predicted phosphatase
MYPLMEPHPHAGAMQQQLINEVSTAAPQDVVVVVTPLSWLQRRESPTQLHTWLDAWLDAQYDLVGVIDLDHVDHGVVEPPPQAPQRFMAHYVRHR